MTEPIKKEKPTCPDCGSDQVNLDAIAEWDELTQTWVLQSTYDNGYCGACESQTKHFNWVTIEDEPKEQA